MDNKDIDLLKENGWVVVCQSPFEIETEDRYSFASNEAAYMVLENLKNDVVKTQKDILQEIIDKQKEYVIVHTICKIKKDEEGKFYPVLDYKELYFMCGSTPMEEHDFKMSVEEDNWDKLIREEINEEGNYWIYIMYSINTDSDDYRSWTYYELEAIQLEWMCSFEDEKNQLDSPDDLFGTWI